MRLHEFEGLKYDLCEGNQMDDCLLKGSCPEPWTWNWIKQFVNSDSICVDVGANFGLFSILMASLGKKVFCFEPMPIIDRLIDNMNLNGFKNYMAYQVVVGDRFRQVKANFQYNWNKEQDIIDEFVTVMVTLDSFLHERVSFIKVDTDGDELRVIDGMRKIISRDLPVVVQELATDTFDFDGKTWSKDRQDNTSNWKKILGFYFGLGYEIKALSYGSGSMNVEELIEVSKDPNISSIDVLLVTEHEK